MLSIFSHTPTFIIEPKKKRISRFFYLHALFYTFIPPELFGKIPLLQAELFPCFRQTDDLYRNIFIIFLRAFSRFLQFLIFQRFSRCFCPVRPRSGRKIARIPCPRPESPTTRRYKSNLRFVPVRQTARLQGILLRLRQKCYPWKRAARPARCLRRLW